MVAGSHDSHNTAQLNASTYTHTHTHTHTHRYVCVCRCGCAYVVNSAAIAE